jgi:small conductance mechanosensitive channel
MEMDEIVRDVTALLAAYGLKLVGALLIVIVGWTASVWAGRAILRISRRTTRIDPTVVTFLASLVRYGIVGFTLLALLAQFGVETTSIIAVLGAASIAIGLALQGTLSHFASGVMLLLFRPFKVGDDIEVAGQAGTVKAITLFTTELSLPDNVLLILPNGAVWGSMLKNFSAHRTRRVDLTLGVSYDNDLERVLGVIRETVAADPRPLAVPEPQVVADALGEMSVRIAVRVWVNSPDYWPFRFDLIRRLKQRLDAEGVALPLAQHVLHRGASGGDPDDLSTARGDSPV